MGVFLSFFFFFNDTATTEIYTLPYTTLFRSKGDVPDHRRPRQGAAARRPEGPRHPSHRGAGQADALRHPGPRASRRSEEHTSELQSLAYLVCRLLLEKKKHGGMSR